MLAKGRRAHRRSLCVGRNFGGTRQRPPHSQHCAGRGARQPVPHTALRQRQEQDNPHLQD